LPNNGWSTFGLAQTLGILDKKEEAKTVQAQFDKIWAKSDVKIKSSCMCQEGVAKEH